MKRLPPHSHLVGLVLLAGLAATAMFGALSLIALHLLTTVVLIVVGIWEEMTLS